MGGFSGRGTDSEGGTADRGMAEFPVEFAFRVFLVPE